VDEDQRAGGTEEKVSGFRQLTSMFIVSDLCEPDETWAMGGNTPMHRWSFSFSFLGSGLGWVWDMEA
jgi:hypothetical protein